MYIPAVRKLSVYCLITCAITLSMIRVFSLGIDQYKTNLQAKIYALSGINLDIGHLHATIQGLSPVIILNDIQVPNPYAPLKLDQLHLTIDWLSFLLTGRILSATRLTLIGANFTLIRQKTGNIIIAGLDNLSDKPPVWLLQGGRYTLLDSHITWQDESTLAPPVLLRTLDVSLSGDHHRHQINLITELPERYGRTLRLSLNIEGNFLTDDSITAQIYAEGDNFRLNQLPTINDRLKNLKFNQGESNFKLWGQWQNNQLTHLSGQLQAHQLELQRGKKKLAIANFQTGFQMVKTPQEWLIELKDFSLSKIKNSFKLAINHQQSFFSASVTQLDLAETSQLIDFFSPFDNQQQATIKQWHLKGRIKNAQGYFDRTHSRYAFTGRAENIFISPEGEKSQIDNLTAQIKGNEQTGKIVFNTHNAQVTLPHIFRQPLPIQQLTGHLNWQQTQHAWNIKSSHLTAINQDIKTNTQIDLVIPKNKQPAIIHLQSHFSQIKTIQAMTRYLPAKKMDKGLVDWLDQALVDGKVEQGDLLIKGPLSQFPYARQEGIFELLFKVSEGKFHYSPQWPNLEKLDARVLFSNSLAVDIFHAESQGVILEQARIRIPSFDSNSFLTVDGKINTRMADGLHFLQHTPLRPAIDNFLQAVNLTGKTQIDLSFKIPFDQPTQPTVNGVVHLNQAALTVKAVDLLLHDVSGEVKFDEKGLFSQKITAKTLGHPLRIKIYRNSLATIIESQGKTHFQQLKKQFSFLDNAWLSDQTVKGTIHYHTRLDLPWQSTQLSQLTIESDLQGVRLNLPAMLGKTAEEKKPLMLQVDLNNPQPLLTFITQYNHDLKAVIRIDKAHQTLHSAAIVYGQGDMPLPSEKGLYFTINQAMINLDHWQGLLTPVKSHAGVRVKQLTVNTPQLWWQQQNRGYFKLDMQQFKGQWQGYIDSLAAKGSFTLPDDFTTGQAIQLDMERVNLSALLGLKFPLNASNIPLPLLNIFSKEFYWHGINWGSLAIDSERVTNGIEFKQISLIAANHTIELTGQWIRNQLTGMTVLEGQLVFDDIGGILNDLDISHSLIETQAHIKLLSHWPGRPYQFSLNQVDALVDINLTNGRIKDIEPGLGRILGLIAMNQWIKRLTLDFTDLYKQGLSFNTIHGNFDINQGIATTRNLQVDAIAARILMNGWVDLNNEQLDYHVRVIPKSAAAIPIAGTIVGGIAGAITQVLTDDYQEGYFFGSQYRITGHWDQIKKIAQHEQDGIFNQTWDGLTDFFNLGQTNKQTTD